MPNSQTGERGIAILSKRHPRSHAYDLVCRHAFGVDAIGSIPAMGSTGGSFGSAEDGECR